jgi:hypothetical protein
MKRWSRYGIAGLLVGCGLSLIGSADAGPYVNVMQPCDCPPNHYSAFHVLTPVAWRWAAWCQGPCRYTFAKNIFPDVPPTHRVVRYHCPSVNPLQFSVENYPGLDGNIPASTYPSSQPSSLRPPQENPPQELPPPREETGKRPDRLQPPEKLPPPREEPNKPN